MLKGFKMVFNPTVWHPGGIHTSKCQKSVFKAVYFSQIVPGVATRWCSSWCCAQKSAVKTLSFQSGHCAQLLPYIKAKIHVSAVC